MAFFTKNHEVSLKMSIRRFLKAPHRDLMVNFFSRFSTCFALAFRSRQGFLSCLFPAASATASYPTTPSRMRFASVIFRLPFRHTNVIAKGFFGVEIRCCPFNCFSAPIASSCCPASPGKQRFSKLSLGIALWRAELLLKFQSVSAKRTESFRLLWTPSIKKVTSNGTKTLIWPSMLSHKMDPVPKMQGTLTIFGLSIGVAFLRFDSSKRRIELGSSVLFQVFQPTKALEICSYFIRVTEVMDQQ